MAGQRLFWGWIGTSIVTAIATAFAAGVAYPTPLLGILTVIAVEAVLLAGLQWSLLRGVDARLARRWILATLVGTFVGRALQGVAEGAMPAGAGGSPAAEYVVVGLVGAAAGALMALPQALALRARVDRAGAWLLARGLAWAIGMPMLVFAGSALSVASQLPLPLAIAALLSAFGAVGAVVGTIEASWLGRLLTLERSRRGAQNKIDERGRLVA